MYAMLWRSISGLHNTICKNRIGDKIPRIGDKMPRIGDRIDRIVEKTG